MLIGLSVGQRAAKGVAGIIRWVWPLGSIRRKRRPIQNFPLNPATPDTLPLLTSRAGV